MLDVIFFKYNYLDFSHTLQWVYIVIWGHGIEPHPLPWRGFCWSLGPTSISLSHSAALVFGSPVCQGFFCLSLKYQFQTPLLTWVSTLPSKFLPPHPLPRASHYSILIFVSEKQSCFGIPSASHTLLTLKKKSCN